MDLKGLRAEMARRTLAREIESTALDNRGRKDKPSIERTEFDEITISSGLPVGRSDSMVVVWRARNDRVEGEDLANL